MHKIFEKSISTFKKLSLPYKVLSALVVFLVFLILYSIISSFFKKRIFRSKKESFESSNPNKDAEVMLFYVDWCPHCTKAKPEWEKIKAKYDGKQVKGHTIVFTEVNCTTENAEVSEMMNKYKITGYPTIKLLKDGQVIDFDGKPTQSALDEFLNTMI
jgi:thiol-disulfide isomerase/thioredoxin